MIALGNLRESDHVVDADECGCAWCGLPVATSSQTASSLRDLSLYCCYGCRFAHAVVQENGAEGAIRWTVLRLGLAIFFTMNLMAFTMTMWSLDVYDVEADPFQQSLYEVFRWLSMLLALPVLVLLGTPLIQNAVEGGLRRIAWTDLLIGVAVTAAWGTSTISVFRGVGSIYFEVGAMVLVMMTLGRWIEATGRHKATEALDRLLTLLPDIVCRVDKHRHEDVISSEDVQIGDELRYRAGERIAVDGVVVSGQTTVDEQTFSGETQPVAKMPGDPVLAGTVNLEGDIVARVTAEFRKGSFGRLLETLQQARRAQGQYQRLADRVSTWFIPVVVFLALAALLIHSSAGVDRALQAAMSVLLIACPCALGLATPLAVWTALSVAARRQVLFRSGEALERLAEVDAVCFDKTGTLTTGRPQVERVFVYCGDGAALPWAEIHDLAAASRHPFSQAVRSWIGQQHPCGKADERHRLTSIQTVPGFGIQASSSDGRTLKLGSAAFAMAYGAGDSLKVANQAPPPELVACEAAAPWPSAVVSETAERSGKQAVSDDAKEWLQQLRADPQLRVASLTIASIDGVPCAAFAMQETVRTEARAALQELSQHVSYVQILSGDRSEKVAALQSELQLPAVQIAGDLQPQDKVQHVKSIRSMQGFTAMVGDGINDAPALAASDVGIAMGCGADVSRDSADVCLLSSNLSRVPWALELAGRTRRVIRQNLLWAFGYNSIGLVFATAGWMNPAIAAALMIASSLLVISNSLRLLHDQPETNELDPAQ